MASKKKILLRGRIFSKKEIEDSLLKALALILEDSTLPVLSLILEDSTLQDLISINDKIIKAKALKLKGKAKK
jgi:hypothetical protein